MIKSLNIQNFKSIKHLHLDCKKINIFIGRPNTGKSNLLESIGIFSLPFGNLKDFMRFESMSNLFYDQELSEGIKIIADDLYAEIEFRQGSFQGSCKDKDKRVFSFVAGYDGGASRTSDLFTPFRFYRYSVLNVFPRQEASFLLPPRGENLLSILQTNKSLRKVVADLFSEFGLRIVLKPQERKIETQKEIEDVIISYPYSLVSDTLQRIIFHLLAIETNKDSNIIFEEPEAHAFPYYTKLLAETIAKDETNQYFISTHNPYFLLSLIEKSPKDDIRIFITYFRDYQTKVKTLSQVELSEALDLDMDIFFNLDRFVEGE